MIVIVTIVDDDYRIAQRLFWGTVWQMIGCLKNSTEEASSSF